MLIGNKGTINIQIDNFSSLREVELTEKPIIANNEWTLGAFSNNHNGIQYLGVFIRCNDDLQSNLWKCKASITVSPLGENSNFSSNQIFEFKRGATELYMPTFAKWSDVIDSKNGFINGNHVIVETAITVLDNLGANLTIVDNFDTPKEQLTDVVLVVEGKKLYVGKQVLASNSPFFHRLFFEDFKEKGQSEVVLEDLCHKEFVELLNLIYPSHFKIGDNNIVYILRMADYFEIWRIMEKCEKVLIASKSFNIVEKLVFAQKYTMAKLQSHCCSLLKTSAEILGLKKHDKYNQLDDKTRGLLFDKLTKLLLEEKMKKPNNRKRKRTAINL